MLLELRPALINMEETTHARKAQNQTLGLCDCCTSSILDERRHMLWWPALLVIERLVLFLCFLSFSLPYVFHNLPSPLPFLLPFLSPPSVLLSLSLSLFLPLSPHPLIPYINPSQALEVSKHFNFLNRILHLMVPIKYTLIPELISMIYCSSELDYMYLKTRKPRQETS